MISKGLRKLFAPKEFQQVSHFSKLNHKDPVRIAVTGAGGQIGYQILFRIASGEMLGKDQPVILHLVDLPPVESVMNGVAMELQDCAFPLLAGIVTTSNQSVGFKDIDYALLIGAKPRGKGQERGDLLNANGQIFISTGTSIGEHAKRSVKVLVVGNPANTNCLIAAHYAKKKGLDPKQFHAMTRLDHDRALYQLANKLNCHVDDVQKFAIWGNHSSTMYPDITHASVKGKSISSLVDTEWVNNTFIPIVQQRGAKIIEARKLSSAASAGNAAMSHIRDWVKGTNGHWTSMAVPSDGSYGIEPGLVFSYPVTVENGEYKIVKNLKITPESQKRIDTTKEELLGERKLVEGLLAQIFKNIVCITQLHFVLNNIQFLFGNFI